MPVQLVSPALHSAPRSHARWPSPPHATQSPDAQVCVVEQVEPQPPQFNGSDWIEVHRPPQSESPVQRVPSHAG